MKSLKVSGGDALSKLDELRSAWKAGSPYPFLVGDQSEFEAFTGSLELPADGGDSILLAASKFDLATWLVEARGAGKPTWPKKALPKQTTLVSLYDLPSNELKPEVFIGFVELDAPHELFARLGFGGWNDCPDPHIHVALHKYWGERFKATPVAISRDIVECFVFSPPNDKAPSLELAVQQTAYCHDIVEQGVGTVGKLGSSLLGAHFWYFWWD